MCFSQSCLRTYGADLLPAVCTQAFAGINPANFSASTLLSIVTYHFCGPVTASYRLLVSYVACSRHSCHSAFQVSVVVPHHDLLRAHCISQELYCFCTMLWPSRPS